MHWLRVLALVSLVSSIGLPSAHAQSPRAGRAMWLQGEVSGVWIGPRRMWAPAAGPEALSACIAQRCAPIVDHQSCTVPECPGDGWVHVVARDLAPVGAFPQDYGGYTQELDALRADARLADLHGYLRDHPERSRREEQRMRDEEARRREEDRHRESVRWVSPYRQGDRWELSLHASIATLGSLGGSFAGGTAALGLMFLAPSDDADDDDGDDAIVNFMLGDVLGGELRVHALARIDGGQEAQWITAVGLGPALSNRLKHTVVRLPSFFGVVIPEAGAIFRADRDPTWYVAWGAPISFLLTHDVALDVTPRLFIVDDWIPKPAEAEDDPVETIVMLSVGLRLP